jgi:hypothetical protein
MAVGRANKGVGDLMENRVADLRYIVSTDKMDRQGDPLPPMVAQSHSAFRLVECKRPIRETEQSHDAKSVRLHQLRVVPRRRRDLRDRLRTPEGQIVFKAFVHLFPPSRAPRRRGS